MSTNKQHVRMLIEKRNYAELNDYLLENNGGNLSKTEKFDLLSFSLKDKKALKMLLKSGFNEFTYPNKNVELNSIFKEAIKNKHWKVAIFLIENYPEEFQKACIVDRKSKDGYRRSNSATMLIDLDLASQIQKKLFALCIKNEDIHSKDSLGMPLIHSLLYSDLHKNQETSKYDKIIDKIKYIIGKVNYDVHIKNNYGDCMLGFSAYKMMLSEEKADSHYLIKNLKILFIEDERNKIKKMMDKERMSMNIESINKNSNKIRI